MNHDLVATRRAAIAANVRAELARRQVRPGELADYLQVARTTVFRRLSAELPWTVDELWCIADRLDVPIEQLVRVNDTAGVVAAVSA